MIQGVVSGGLVGDNEGRLKVVKLIVAIAGGLRAWGDEIACSESAVLIGQG